MGLLKTFMDPEADFRQRARERIAEQKAVNISEAASQQEKRAAKMAAKLGRGNRRAAKAAMRASALREQASSVRLSR